MPLSQQVQVRIHTFCDAWGLAHRPDLNTAAKRTTWGDDVLAFIEGFKNNFTNPTFQKYYEVTRKDLLRPGVAEGFLSAADLAVIDAYVQRAATVPA